MKLTEKLIQEYSYTEETRALLNSHFKIQDLSDLLFNKYLYEDNDITRNFVKFNTKLNLYYIVKVYIKCIKDRYINTVNILGFELYSNFGMYDIIIPYDNPKRSRLFFNRGILYDIYYRSSIKEEDNFIFIYKDLITLKDTHE